MSRRTALGKAFRSRRDDATHRRGFTSPGTIRVYVSPYTGQAIRNRAQIVRSSPADKSLRIHARTRRRVCEPTAFACTKHASSHRQRWRKRSVTRTRGRIPLGPPPPDVSFIALPAMSLRGSGCRGTCSPASRPILPAPARPCRREPAPVSHIARADAEPRMAADAENRRESAGGSWDMIAAMRFRPGSSGDRARDQQRTPGAGFMPGRRARLHAHGGRGRPLASGRSR
jgi:hypothetical protein